MKALELEKLKEEEKLDGRTIEAQIASWYKPPKIKTVLTEELAHEIAECFLDGFTDEETADMCNVDPMTLKKWRNLSVIRNHERSRKKFYIHEIRDGKRRDWTRLAWWLERRYPLEFSRPEVAHAISTSIHTTVNTTQNLIVSSELAEQLAERNAKIATKIEELFAGHTKGGPGAHNIKEVMCYNTEALEGTQAVKDIVTSITSNESVVTEPNVDKSSFPHPPFIDPAGVTPLVAAGQPTDQLSPTGTQKSKRLGRKAVKALLQIPEDAKNSSGSDDDITRKKFDMSARLTKKKSVGKTQPIELEGQIKKVRTKSIVTVEDRPALAAEITRRSRETKLDRAKLRAANKVADKLHPRKAHK